MSHTACTQPQCLYSTAIPLLPLWTVQPVQSLGACTRVHFTLFLFASNSHKYGFCTRQISIGYITSTISNVAVLGTSNLQTKCTPHIYCESTLTFLHTQLRVLSSNGSSGTAVKPTAIIARPLLYIPSTTVTYSSRSITIYNYFRPKKRSFPRRNSRVHHVLVTDFQEIHTYGAGFFSKGETFPFSFFFYIGQLDHKTELARAEYSGRTSFISSLHQENDSKLKGTAEKVEMAQ